MDSEKIQQLCDVVNNKINEVLLEVRKSRQRPEMLDVNLIEAKLENIQLGVATIHENAKRFGE